MYKTIQFLKIKIKENMIVYHKPHNSCLNMCYVKISLYPNVFKDKLPTSGKNVLQNTNLNDSVKYNAST